MRASFFVGVFIAATASLLAACAVEEEASSGPTPLPQGSPTAASNGAPAAFETIDIGEQSGISGGQPQVLKIDRQDRWEEFWSRHEANRTEARPAPTVDFSREMVIAAVDQQEPSGGYGFEITEIEETDGRLEVRVSKEAPGPDCIVTTVITRPFHIVRLAASDLEPELVIGEEVYSCG